MGLAVGDDSYYNPARNRKGEDGVIIEQPNFLTSPMKSGKNDDTLFHNPGYLAVGKLRHPASVNSNSRRGPVQRPSQNQPIT